MLRPIARRLASAAATLFGASLLIFVVLDCLPGNAAATLLGTAARPDTVAALQRQLGLDQPAPLRYAGWIAGTLHGDLGQSATYGVPVAGLIAERLAVTLPLAFLALCLAIAVGLLVSVEAAARPGQVADRAAALFAQFGIAVPDFWVGILLILLPSTTLRWFAAGGFPGWAEPGAALKAPVLPAVALALPQAASLTRIVPSAFQRSGARAGHPCRGAAGLGAAFLHGGRGAGQGAVAHHDRSCAAQPCRAARRAGDDSVRARHPGRGRIGLSGAQPAAAQTYLGQAPWMAVAPGLAIAVAVLGLNLLGDGLRDWFDPRAARRP